MRALPFNILNLNTCLDVVPGTSLEMELQSLSGRLLNSWEPINDFNIKSNAIMSVLLLTFWQLFTNLEKINKFLKLDLY